MLNKIENKTNFYSNSNSLFKLTFTPLKWLKNPNFSFILSSLSFDSVFLYTKHNF